MPRLRAIFIFILVSLMSTGWLLKHRFQLSLSELAQRGIFVEIHSWSLKDIDLSIHSPTHGLSLEHMRPQISMTFLPPKIHIEWNQPLQKLGGNQFLLSEGDSSIAVSLGLTGRPNYKLHIENGRARFQSSSLSHLSLRITGDFNGCDIGINSLLDKEPLKATLRLTFQKKSFFPSRIETSAGLGPHQLSSSLTFSETDSAIDGRLEITLPNLSQKVMISGTQAMPNFHFLPQTNSWFTLREPLELSFTDNFQKAIVSCKNKCLMIAMDKGLLEVRQLDLKIADLVSRAPTFKGRLRNISVKNQSISPERSLSGNFSGRLIRDFQKVNAQGNFSDDSGMINLDFSSRADLKSLQFELNSNIGITLSPESGPGLYFPKLKDQLNDWFGIVKLNFTVSGDSQFFQGHCDIPQLKLSGNLFGQPFKGLNVTGGIGIETKARRLTIKARSLASPIKLEELGGEIEATTLSGKAHLKFYPFSAKLLGGMFALDAFSFSEGKPFTAHATLTQLDLSHLVSALKLEKLQGTGRLDGMALIQGDGSKIQLEKATLFGTSGTLQFTDESNDDLPKIIQYLDEFQKLLGRGSKALVTKELENFHYSTLRLEISRRDSGRLGALLFLRGMNPNVAKGQVFEFNIPIEGDLEQLLLKSATVSDFSGFSDISNVSEFLDGKVPIESK